MPTILVEQLIVTAIGEHRADMVGLARASVAIDLGAAID
jgi:hypothetical protein